MPMCADGLAKLIEECGELQQIAGKKLAYFHTDDHPDGQSLKQRLEHEIADVRAACDFVTRELGLNVGEIFARYEDKLALFRRWHADRDNNADAIDRGRTPIPSREVTFGE